MEKLPFITDITASTCFCVSSQFPREEIKEMLFLQKHSLTRFSVVTISELCLALLGEKNPILPASTRRQIYKRLLSEFKEKKCFPLLQKWSKQKNFFQTLDLSLQESRLFFSHPEEQAVLTEHITQKMGFSDLKKEIQEFAYAFEIYLQASKQFDLASLLTAATQKLPECAFRPEVIFRITQEQDLPREKLFWQTLSTVIPVKKIPFSRQKPMIKAFRYHTLDYAAQDFSLFFTKKAKKIALLIPDDPTIRSLIQKTLKQMNTPLLDPRDPTQAKRNEKIKALCLPLQLITSDFEATAVISWLYLQKEEEWILFIQKTGIVKGLEQYQVNPELFQALQKLQENFHPSCFIHEFEKTFLSLIFHQLKMLTSPTSSDLALWHQAFSLIEKTLQGLIQDLTQAGMNQKRCRGKIWASLLLERFFSEPPEVHLLKPIDGIRLYRTAQASLLDFDLVIAFGIAPFFLSQNSDQNLWFCRQAQEACALEFELPSLHSIKAQKLALLSHWIHSTQKMIFMDAHFSVTAEKNPPMETLLYELQNTLQEAIVIEEKIPFSPPAQKHPQTVFLPPKAGALSATQIDYYSRCPFQSAAYHRWKLSDVILPSFELHPMIKGLLLHEAAHLLIKDNQFIPEKILEKIWPTSSYLFQSPKIIQAEKNRMQKILLAFCEKEAEYQKNAQIKTLSQDDCSFQMELDGVVLTARPDRIDETADGALFLIEYKTSSQCPTAPFILDHGYRLQMGVYALLAHHTTQKPIAGLQYVQLNTKAVRNQGVLFLEHNKKNAYLTQVRSNAQSLVDINSETLLSVITKHLKSLLLEFKKGNYTPSPHPAMGEAECNRCALGYLCGVKRK